MAGFNDWIEIFKGGTQADADGRLHDGDALIDMAVSTFDPEKMEPPLVVGHPKDNAPAFGWVQGLKKAVKDGSKVLMMKAKDVVPEFAELVKANIYKKRSASFFPDGRLRHVGFLGGAIPAVKGLADMEFKEAEAISFEFSAEKQEEKDMGFTQEEMDKAVEVAVGKAQEKASIEFAEKERAAALENDREKARTRLKELREKGNIPPAVFISGTAEFMDSQHGTSFDFKADDGEKKQTPAAWLLSFMENLDTVLEPLADNLTTEFASKDKADKDKTKQEKEAEEDEANAKDIANRVAPKKTGWFDWGKNKEE